MGATSGIGRAAALRLAAGGTRVSVVGRSAEKGAEVEREARERGGQARFFAADLSAPGAAVDVVARAVNAFGPFDAAVNSAAGTVLDGLKRLHELDDGAFDRALVDEMRICVDSLRAELAHAMAEGGRRTSIVNVSSINGLGASPRAPFYSAVKAAQLALTKNTALDYASDGIRVNAVVLGAFDTPMLAATYEAMGGGNQAVMNAMREQFLGIVPLKRLGNPEEAAAVIEWLCSPESSYATGASWIVDGGITAFAR
jgi:NAD(P)-dependent dehydrogenase (short-subunit alcohol dehydrogenase family)